MGYYTAYKLETDEQWPEHLVAELEAHENIPCAINVNNGSTYDTCKWYDHEDDMKEISKKFPNIVFTLHGEGEEGGDIWKKYFKDGKIQRSRTVITFEPYDPERLK